MVSRTSDEAAEERSAIYLAVMEFFRNRLNTSDMDILKRLLKSTLPEIQVPETNRESHDLCRESHEELREAIKMQLGERHLQQLAELIEKVYWGGGGGEEREGNDCHFVLLTFHRWCSCISHCSTTGVLFSVGHHSVAGPLPTNCWLQRIGTSPLTRGGAIGTSPSLISLC